MIGLSNLEPKFGGSVQNFIGDLNKQYASQGITFQPVYGYRSMADQKKLWDAYAAGKAQGKPDSELVKAAPPGQSFHNFGGAVDIMPFRNGIQLSNAEAIPILNTVGPTASRYGMTWGGSFDDRDHFQASPHLQPWLDVSGRRNWKGPDTSEALAQPQTPQTPQTAQTPQTPVSQGHFDIVPQLEQAITSTSSRLGVPGDYLRTIAMIESRGGRLLSTPLSSAKGPFQFINSTAAKYGLTNPMDFQQSADAAAKFALDNKSAMERLMGRPVSWGEVYLAHQQGTGSAQALLDNPNRPAKDLIGYKAVQNNIPKGSGYSAGTITAGQLSNIWLSKYSNIAGGDGGTSGGSSSSATPATPGGATPTTSTPAGDTPRTYPTIQLTPEQRFESSLGQALAGMSAGGAGGSSTGIASEGHAVSDPIDQPAIRMPALDAASRPMPDAVPAQYSQGLGGQLASLAAQPVLMDPEANPANMQSLTQGAPGMTALLGTMGTPSTFNYTDPRAAQPIPNSKDIATKGIRF